MKKWLPEDEVASHCHPHCHCKIIAGETNTTVEGYDPQGITTRMCDISQSIDIAFDWKDYIADPHIQRQIQQELTTRDPMWVLTGKVPEVVLEKGARPNINEVASANRLGTHGFPVSFRATREAENKKTSDLLIAGKEWEIKQPHGSGKNNINNQFNEARGQAQRLIIDTSTSPFTYEDVLKRAKECLLSRTDFKEVIIVNDVRLVRIKK